MRSNDITEKSGQIVIRGLIVLVRLWQTLFSAWMAPSCRFVPSCSEYSIQALHEHGLVKGCWLTICRLARCHPFGGSGLDEVPACAHDHHRPRTDSGATTREDKSNGLNSI